MAVGRDNGYSGSIRLTRLANLRFDAQEAVFKTHYTINTSIKEPRARTHRHMGRRRRQWHGVPAAAGLCALQACLEISWQEVLLLQSTFLLTACSSRACPSLGSCCWTWVVPTGLAGRLAR